MRTTRPGSTSRAGRRTRRRSRSPSAVRRHGRPCASAALGLMGGVDETVGFNLTGTDWRARRDARRRPRPGSPSRRVEAARARHRTDRRRARTTRAKSRRAQELSSEALDLARSTGDARADRGGARSAPHRAVVPGGARRPARNWTTSSAPSGGRSRCRRRCGASATCSSAVGWRKRIGRWRRWRAVRSCARSRVHAGTPRCTARCARRSTGRPRRRVGQLRGSATPWVSRSGPGPPGVTYAVQSLFIARERRELGGLIELLDTLAAEHPHQPGFVTTATWVRVETGRFDEAREPFDAIGADGFASIPRNGVWLPSMRLLTDIAYEVGDACPRGCALRAAAPVSRSLHRRRRACSRSSGRSSTHSACSRSAPAISTGRRITSAAPVSATRSSAQRCSRPGSTSRWPRCERHGATPSEPGPAAPRSANGSARAATDWADVVHDAHPEGFLSEHTFASLTVACCTSGRCSGAGEPAIDRGRRYESSARHRRRCPGRADSWVDVSREWLGGADTLLDALIERVAWKQGKRWMYERMVDDPRLSRWFPPTEALPAPGARAAEGAR